MSFEQPIGTMQYYSGEAIPEGWSDVSDIFRPLMKDEENKLYPAEVLDYTPLKIIMKVGDMAVEDIMKNYNIKEKILSFEF